MKNQALARWVQRNARAVLAALARSDDEGHRALAAEMAPLIGATVDRLEAFQRIPPTSFGRR